MPHEGYDPIRDDFLADLATIDAVERGELTEGIVFMPGNRPGDRNATVTAANTEGTRFLLDRSYRGRFAHLVPGILSEKLLTDPNLYPDGNRLPFESLNQVNLQNTGTI